MDNSQPANGTVRDTMSFASPSGNQRETLADGVQRARSSSRRFLKSPLHSIKAYSLTPRTEQKLIAFDKKYRPIRRSANIK